MKKLIPKPEDSNNESKKVQIVSKGLNLQKLFEQHGDQFLKWNFLPFLQYNDRKSLRSSCTSIKRFIPAPRFIYVKTRPRGFESHQYATARLEKITGHVETRGDPSFGGNSENVANELQSNVVEICPNVVAFAALKKNGKVVTWGSSLNGGDTSSVSSELQRGVVKIVSTRGAFAALTQNGKVISWGRDFYGGDSSSVREDLQSDVTQLVGNKGAFAALKSNGKIISWGRSSYGGNSSHLSSLNSGVITIEAIRDGTGFCATKHDGSVIEWPLTLYD